MKWFVKENDSKMEKNEISAPIILQEEDGRKAYRIVKVRKKINAHTANLIDDYDKIRNVALSEKKQEKVNKWLKDKIIKTYITIQLPKVWMKNQKV